MKNLKPTLLFKSIAHQCMLTFCLLFLSANITAQETLCGDGLDNDGDGLYDCADSDCSASCPDAFQCESTFYQRISDQFLALNVMTGNYDNLMLANPLLINNLHGGYNVRDGYMYGMKHGNGTSSRLYRVDKTNGAVWVDNSCTLTGPGGFSGIAGDMDYDNHLYLLDVPAAAVAIDYLTQVNVSNCTSDTRNFSSTLNARISDMAFISNVSTATDKIFYAIADDQQLYQITWGATTAAWTVLENYSAVTMSTEGYGAQWYDSPNNTLYASQNNTGQIYKIDLATTAIITLVQTGQSTSNNDGFSCSLAAAPFAAALPVELISFTTDVTDCMADLKWLTASEENTAHFEIQQSKDGKQWTTIEKLAAAVNSQTERNYNFATRLQAQQTTYFRLKMVDLDGSFAYSPVRTTVCEKDNHRNFIAYPNPVNNLLHIDGLTVGTRIKLVRVDGVICKDIAANAQEMELDLSDLCSGLYVLQVQDENGRSSFQKITKR